jgi:F-type H+-transporting ATPase subunit gamma
MPSVRDLRDRIRSLKNTQQITKAMKQVAAAKIRRAELAQKQARPYAQTIGEMLRDLMASVGSPSTGSGQASHPFMRPGRAGAPSGVILMTADKGLAGAFNSNVIRAGELYRKDRANAQFYTVGIKARNAVRRWGVTDHPTWILNAPSKLQTAREVARRVTDDFIAGKIGDITLISSKLVSMMSQRPETRHLVPIERTAQAEAAASGPRGSVEFAPSPEFVLSRLLPKYLEFTIFSAMLETDAAFFAAQLLAMNNATDNAGKLIDELTIAMNNARQAAITKELLEIVGGAEALTNA